MNNNPVVIRAAIIEDEIPAARLLNHMLAELRPEWEILLLLGNIEEAAEWFSENTHPDLLFLDIQLTDGNSFLLIEKACPKSMIVFTTAFDTYAVRAFTVNSIDYLLKPIHRERLAETLDKLSEQLNPDYFFRTNRQTLVGIDAIRKIEPYFQNKVVVDVIPPFKDKILVSKEKIASFKVWLNY